jgi:hypothetical protein
MPTSASPICCARLTYVGMRSTMPFRIRWPVLYPDGMSFSAAKV